MVTPILYCKGSVDFDFCRLLQCAAHYTQLEPECCTSEEKMLFLSASQFRASFAHRGFEITYFK